jgi:hypothetical protein
VFVIRQPLEQLAQLTALEVAFDLLEECHGAAGQAGSPGDD